MVILHSEICAMTSQAHSFSSALVSLSSTIKRIDRWIHKAYRMASESLGSMSRHMFAVFCISIDVCHEVSV